MARRHQAVRYCRDRRASSTLRARHHRATALRGRWLAGCEAGLSGRRRLRGRCGAVVVTGDETPNTGCLGWLVEGERIDELIALVLTHNRGECLLDVRSFRTDFDLHLGSSFFAISSSRSNWSVLIVSVTRFTQTGCFLRFLPSSAGEGVS